MDAGRSLAPPGKIELLGAGAAFVASTFSLAAIFGLLALKGGRYA